MTPTPEKPPLSLEELLKRFQYWTDEPPTSNSDRYIYTGLAEEMAARLRLIDGLHQQEPSGEDYEAECMGCEEIWPCSTRRALDGERTDEP